MGDRIIPNRACPVCGDRRAEQLQRMVFALPDGHPLPTHYDVIRCDHCSFVYADTQALQADYDAYYADLSKYADTTTATGAGVQVWDQVRLAETAAQVHRYVAPSDFIVDIGCANGGLLAELAALGHNRVFGVDPSAACVAATAAIPGVSADIGTLFALPSRLREVDCVILSHVLEHVRDVTGALGALRSILTAEGLVYVEVPDAARYGDCLVAPFQDFNVEHINHFSATSLSNALAANGFAVEQTFEKTIQAAAGVPYPAVAAVARRSRTRSTLVADERLRLSIPSYIERSRVQVATLDRNLDAALEGVRRVVIWGTGQTTLTLLAHTKLGGAKPVALTDSNPRYHGRRLAGVPVVAPEELTRYEVPILVGSLIHYPAIEARIREIGLPNPVIRLSVQ